MLKTIGKTVAYIIASGIVLWGLDKYIDNSIKVAVLESNDKIESLQDSLSTTQMELNKYKSGVIELSEGDCVEIFERTYILCFYNISYDERFPRDMYCSAYIRFKPLNVIEEKPNEASSVFPAQYVKLGESLSISNDSTIYNVHVLGIDDKKNTAKFSFEKRQPGQQ